MKTLNRKISVVTALLCASVVSLSCSNKGKPGDQDDPPPFVSAQVFGVNASTTGTLEVRSGSDVILSGSTSDGLDDPIISFQWQQTDSSGYNVDLYERATSTVAFTAPKIPLGETNDVILDFTLTVTDADGVTASDTVSVRVIPVDDVDHFLLPPSLRDEYLLVVAADPTTTLSNDIPVELTVTSNVQWNDRSGNSRSMDFDSKTYSGTVPMVAGAGPIADESNLFFKIPIPYLDIDLVNTNFQGANRGGRLELELVDAATVTTTITFQQSATGSVNVYMVDSSMTDIVSPQSIDGSGDTPVPAAPIIDAVGGDTAFVFDPELMRQALDFESKLSANNYYNCIDPPDEMGNRKADTLAKWLDYAGINPDLSNATRTAYANNYDLGFGRDMYTRVDANGNVYSLVTNYPNLENTLSQRNDFAVVVMEFSPAPTNDCGDGDFEDDVTGRKIVKFYAYVPDENSGAYLRAPSMNFDGRGEKYLPGVCTACHGGSPNPAELNNSDFTAINASEADLSAGFMPWDLDSLLYTDSVANSALVDPVYAGDQLSAAVTQRFSRETQQAAFRQQNTAALMTFTYSAETMRRFEEPIRLVHGWYGNSALTDTLDFSTLSDPDLLALQSQLQTLPANDFDGSYVQPGWIGQETLYQQVFARNCRLCHVQLDPGDDDIIHFANYDDFVGHEDLAFQVFEQGTMPASRFTMDRFWVDFYGNQSGAEILRAHLNSDAFPGNDVAISAIPGQPVAIIAPISPEEDENGNIEIDFDGQQIFNGEQSFFSDTFQWLVDGLEASNNEEFLFSGLQRQSQPDDTYQIGLIVSDFVSGITSPQKLRQVNVRNYTPTLTGIPPASVNAGGTVPINIYDSICPNFSEPDNPNCRTAFGDIIAGETPEITVVTEPMNGNVVVDNISGVVTFESTSAMPGNDQFMITLTDSFGEASSATPVTVTVNPTGAPEANLDRCDVIYAPSSTYDYLPGNMGTAGVCIYPLNNDTTNVPSMPPEPDLTIVSVGQPIVDPMDSASEGVTTFNQNTGEITYSPPTFFFNGDSQNPRRASFPYTIQDRLEQTDDGTMEVLLEATQPYNSTLISGVLVGGSCNGCHGSSTFSWNFNRLLNSVTSNHDVSTSPSPPPAPTGNIVIDISRGSTTTEAQILNSRFFRRGCTASASHGGGNVLCDADPLTPGNQSPGLPINRSHLLPRGEDFLNWVLEGAANNAPP